MRMWMVDPRILCYRHLLGEHVECHMFVGSLKKKIKMNGYFRNNLFEPLSLQKRHDLLTEEMSRREIKHKSPLILDENLLQIFKPEELNYKVDQEKSLIDLINRCDYCKERYKWVIQLENNYTSILENY